MTAPDEEQTHDPDLPDLKSCSPSAAALARLQEHRQALADQAADPDASYAVGTDRAGLRPRDRARERCRPHLHAQGEPLGERIVVHGHVLDEDGRGVPNTLVELWQANACGRYIHIVDQHPAPLDPNSPAPAARRRMPRVTIASSPSSPAPIPGATTITPGARPIFISRCSGILCVAAGDADVFPRRSLVPVRPDLQFGHRGEGAQPDGLGFDLENTKPDWALCYASTSCCAGATPRRWRPSKCRQSRRE